VRSALTFFAILTCYGLFILAVDFNSPLRLGEILQAAAFVHFSWASFFGWIAQTPRGAPLSYLVQLPFTITAPDSRLLLRLPSLLCALLSALVFFVLAKRIPLQNPMLALVLFLAIPTHLAYASQGRPHELGLFVLLLATLFFFTLVNKPSVAKALGYAFLLTACVYTEPSCYLPAMGYLLGLLGFANLKTYRRALWYVLAATIFPLIAYAPYYAWAGVQRSGDWWLTEQFPAYAVKVPGLEALMSLDSSGLNPWFGITLMGVLLFGLVGGVWSAMPLGSYPEGAPPPRADVVKVRAILFCLAVGAMVTFLGETAFTGFYGLSFAPYQILWAVPGMIIVFCAALDVLVRLPVMKSISPAAPAVCIFAILLCLPGDLDYLRTKPPNMAELTALVRPQLTGDACVVFVSERLSKYLFEVFDPGLQNYECQNFFHKRTVLAIHPFVRADQERDARVFFRGLEFKETHIDAVDGGKVIAADAQR
jgi:hypothetical protein